MLDLLLMVMIAEIILLIHSKIMLLILQMEERQVMALSSLQMHRDLMVNALKPVTSLHINAITKELIHTIQVIKLFSLT